MVDDSSADRDPVEVLAEEFLERLRKGERPSLAEYKERYPDLAEDIDDVFPALAMMDEIDPSARELSEPAPTEDAILPKLEQIGDFRIIREVGRGGMGVVYEAEQVSLGRHVALKVLPSSALPDSKHVRRFEREAKSAAKLHHTNIVPVFGVGTEDELHYYVMQFIQGLPLDEVIDELKKIRSQPTGAITTPERASQAGDSSRDAREQSVADVARSLMTGQFAQTQIGDSDPDADGASAIAPARTVTELSPEAGDTSTSRLSETFNLSGSFSGSAVRLGKSGVQSAQRKPLTYWESVANIGMQVADAMHYAHGQGILHRDIKPSNLLLDLRGTTWVTDFGLAKATDQQDITHTGDILGTLRYMPPEAFEGKTDARSDVYSLGLTLYELLAFQPAFGNRDRHQLVKQVTTEAAPRLDKLNPEVPRDLVTIVHKAIDRDASHRYQTARELEEDLQRFLEDEPIKARRISLAERFSRWSRRNRGLAAALTAVCVLLLVINTAGPLMYWRMADLKQEADQGRRDAEQKNGQLIASEGRLSVAVSELEDTITDLEREQRSRLQAEQNALDKAEEALAARDEVTLGAAYPALTTPGQHFHGKELLDDLRPRPGEKDRRGIEWYLLDSLPDPSGGRILANIGGAFRSAVCLSPDDSDVAVADASGDILILDGETGAVVKRLVGHTSPVRKLVWVAAGNRLVSADYDSVRVWDVESGLELMSLPTLGTFALAPDETRLATSTDDGLLQIRDISNGELRETFERDDQSVNDLDWSVEDQIASVGGGTEVHLLDIETGKWRVLPGTSSESESPANWLAVCFSPNGSQLAAVSMSPRGQPVTVWDLNSDAEPTTLPALMGVADVEWSHDGSRLATTSYVGRAVEIWDAAAGERVRRLSGHSEGVGGCSWSHDDRQVVSASRDGTVRIWKMDGEVAAPEFAGHQGLVSELAWSPGSRYFATAGYDGSVRIWDVRSPRESVATFRGHQSQYVTGMDWHPRANRLASSGSDGVLIWEWDGGNNASVVAEFPDSNGRVADVVWSPDGTQIATAGGTSDEYYVRTFDALTHEKLLEFPLGRANSVSWEQDREGNSLLATAGSQEVTVWNVETEEVVRTWSAPNEIYTRVALSPRGDRVAFSGSASGVAFDEDAGSEPILGILDLDTGVVRRLQGHEGTAMSISWTADGTRLLTAGMDGTAILWNADTGRQLVTFDAPDRVFLYAAQFSPDQLRIAIAGAMPGVQVLNATPSYVEELAPKLELGLATRIEMDPTARDLVLRGRVLAKQGRWDEAVADFDRAASLSAANGSSPSWFETTWWVAGPYAEALADPQPPEQQTDPFQPIPLADESAGETNWSAAPFTSALDLGRLFDHAEHISAYALTRIYSMEPQEIGLLLGADDQVKVWSNGADVYTRAADSKGIRDDEAVGITLERGWNTLLVKVANNTGAHGLFARLSDDPRELAGAFDRNEQFEQAMRWADRALADSPDDAPLLYVRGRAALRTGRRQAAEESFDHVVETVSKKELAQRRIVELYLEHARSLIDGDRSEAAAESLNRARDLYEQLAGSEVANARDAAGLADVLIALMPQVRWTVLEPVAMTSEGGATLTSLDDGSILAGGANPLQEVYTISTRPQQQITCIELQTMPHPSLPYGRSGREPGTGNFLITRFGLAVQDNGTGQTREIQIGGIASDFSALPRGGTSYVENMLGRGPAPHWTAFPDIHIPHRVVLELKEPISIPENGVLQVTIDCRDPDWPQHALGRFRLSVSDSPTAFADEQRRLAALKVGHAWEQLAAVYHLTGNEAALDALLERNPAAAAGIVALAVDAAGWAQDEVVAPTHATEAIERALQSNPNSVDFANRLLEICSNARAWQVGAAGLQTLIDHQRNAGAPPAQLAHALRLRGALQVRAGQWQSAADDYAESVALDPKADSIAWMVPSVLYAYAGDPEGHRRQCRAMLEHFENLDRSEEYDESSKAPNADRTLKVMLLLEHAFESELKPEDVLVSRFLNALQGDALSEVYRKYFLSGLALLALRCPDLGGLQAAQRSLDESKGTQYRQGDLGLLQRAVQALILAKQEKRADDARPLLQELKTRMTTEYSVKWLDDGTIDGNTVFYQDGRVVSDLLIPEILRREAERLLEGGSADGAR